MFRFRDFTFLKIYIGCITLYALAAVAAVVWAYQGPVVSGASYQSRVFRTPDSVPVNQLYSGVALSALLAPAGMLVQWIMHEFRHLRLFALTAQRPVALADLDKIGDDSSAWTLRILGKYSWWYAVMQGALIAIRTTIVPVGTLLLTTGVHRENVEGFGVVGLPILPDTNSNVRRLATAMGWNEEGTFSPTFNAEDDFLSQTEYTFVGNIVGQSALVDVSKGRIGPTSTHNITYNTNTTYYGLIFFTWDGKCEPALEIPYITWMNGSRLTYNVTMPDSTNLSLPINLREAGGTQTLQMWNSVPLSSRINDMPTSGTTYLISAAPGTRDINKNGTSSPSLVQTAEGHWISRTKCNPEFSWEVGSCLFNGTVMTECKPGPGTNTTALDVEALDRLVDYVAAIPWFLWKNQISAIDKTFDYLYAIPVSEDWGHFFGNLADALAAIATAGYFGTATVPVVTEVPEDVYIVRTAVLWVILAMFTIVPLMSCIDIWRSKSRGLPFRSATFLAIANAVRGPWWDRELYGSCAADEVSMQKRSASSVMFGVDANNPYHVGLLPAVLPIQRGQPYFGV
ncbi:hypothetical protein CPLU01_09267 [Colletotrichum plurivorum]|uniref:Uncharacterized protein n=1 Tax=Colletotrichum plurivorum TaxID=2175906 RepID=A0A8H6NC25_9PEZI|nr:hypothetical protein CPLU01_09267 [Colletotrichum plurivorum]